MPTLPHIHMCTCSMLAEFRKSVLFGFHVFDPTVAWISSRVDPTNIRGRGYFCFIVRLYFPGLVAVAGIGVVQWQIISADLFNKYSGTQEDKPLASHYLSFSWIKPVRDLLTQNLACRPRYIPSQEKEVLQTSSRSGGPPLIGIDNMLIHPAGCYRWGAGSSPKGNSLFVLSRLTEWVSGLTFVRRTFATRWDDSRKTLGVLTSSLEIFIFV